jgi:hypothetical protein
VFEQVKKNNTENQKEENNEQEKENNEQKKENDNQKDPKEQKDDLKNQKDPKDQEEENNNQKDPKEQKDDLKIAQQKKEVEKFRNDIESQSVDELIALKNNDITIKSYSGKFGLSNDKIKGMIDEEVQITEEEEKKFQDHIESKQKVQKVCQLCHCSKICF